MSTHLSKDIVGGLRGSAEKSLCAGALIFLLAANSTTAVAGSKLAFAYSTPGTLTTSDPNWEAIPGLSITLPKATSKFPVALVILNLPATIALGHYFPGGGAAIGIDGTLAPYGGAMSAFSADVEDPQGSGSRQPSTLQVLVKLASDHNVVVRGLWAIPGDRAATLVLDSPASISAVTYNQP